MKTGTDKSVVLILFEAISEALQDLLADKTIGSIEVWNDQPLMESQERPRSYPYVCVDISVNWERESVPNTHSHIMRLAQNQQNGDATVDIHVIFESLKDETASFQEIEPVRFQVHRKLNGLTDDDYFSKMIRVSSGMTPTAHDRIIDLKSTYTCRVTEAAALHTWTERTISADFEPEYE